MPTGASRLVATNKQPLIMMSEIITRRPAEGAEPGSPALEKGGGMESALPARCTCQRCGLYRWYPLMMLGSTALAAVFCWMYITKPVFLSAPSGQTHDAHPAIQEKRPIEHGEPAPHTAHGGNLDPALGHLPGDPAPETSSPPVEELLGEELKPLVVKRECPSLFEPIPKSELSGRSRSPSSGAAEGAAPIVIKRESAPEPLVIRREEENTARGEEQPGEDHVGLVAPGEGGRNSDSEEFQVRASLLAEFSSGGKTSGVSPNRNP